MKLGLRSLRNPYVIATAGLILLFFVLAVEIRRQCRHLCPPDLIGDFLWGPGFAVSYQTESYTLEWIVSILFWFGLSVAITSTAYAVMRARGALRARGGRS